LIVAAIAAKAVTAAMRSAIPIGRFWAGLVEEVAIAQTPFGAARN